MSKSQLIVKRIITLLLLFTELSVYKIAYELWCYGAVLAPIIALIENTLMIGFTIKLQYDIEREHIDEDKNE